MTEDTDMTPEKLIPAQCASLTRHRIGFQEVAAGHRGDTVGEFTVWLSVSPRLGKVQSFALYAQRYGRALRRPRPGHQLRAWVDECPAWTTTVRAAVREVLTRRADCPTVHTWGGAVRPLPTDRNER